MLLKNSEIVLELGRTLEPLSEAAHNGANKVRGCVSQVWLELGDGANATGERVLHYRGDSDSHLVRGLIAIALALTFALDQAMRAEHPSLR